MKRIYKQYLSKAKTLIVAVLGLISSYVSLGQNIDATVVGGNCAGSFTLTHTGVDVSGYNTYSAIIYGVPSNLSWTGASWQIIATIPFVGVQTIFYNTTNTSPTPPCHNNGTWVSGGVCAGGMFTSSNNCTVIPVELVSFSIQNKGGTNQLMWQTASEVNNKGFYVQRSADGQIWHDLGFIGSKGQKGDYVFTDPAPLSMSYYRLRQTDFDGQEVLSKVVSTSSKNIGFLKSYPNPVSSILTIESNIVAPNEVLPYQIVNLLGQQVMQGTTTQIVNVSGLPQGAYFLKVGTEKVRFVKQ